jgi:hypothetical protein
LARFTREWRNRQTRTVQVRVSERTWGFNSPLAHVMKAPVSRPGPFVRADYAWLGVNRMDSAMSRSSDLMAAGVPG